MNPEEISLLPIRARSNYLDKLSKIELASNLYKVTFNQNTNVYIHTFKLKPEIHFDNRSKFKNLIEVASSKIEAAIGPYVLAGRVFFGCVKTENTQAKIYQPFGNQNFEISLKLVKSVHLADVHCADHKKSAIAFNFFNNMIKTFFTQMKYLEIGKTRKYFDMSSKHCLANAGVMIYKGYATSFCLMESGLFLKVDPAMKIIRNQTVLEVINSIYSKHNDKSKNQKRQLILDQLLNKTVMANYGKSQTYFIEEILFDKNVENYTFDMKGQQITLEEYYKQVYSINIQNKRQPLVKASTFSKKNTIQTVLIPEILLMTGLTDDFDERKRRQISEYTNNKPVEKYDDVERIMKKIYSTISEFSPQNLVKSLGIEFQKKVSKVQAKRLPCPFLELGNRQRIEENKVASFQLFNKKIFDASIDMNLAIISDKNFDMNTVKSLFSSTCNGLGINYKIKNLTVAFNDARSCLKDIEQIMINEGQSNKTNAFWVILPSSFKSQYKNIKKITVKSNIQQVSQITIASTLNKKGLNSILTKILLQINVKIGNKLWVPRLSKSLESSGVMLVGIESMKDKENKNNTIVAYCSNVCPNMSEFYSNYALIDQTNSLSLKIRKIMIECITEYIKKNQTPPTNIIILKNSTQKSELEIQLKAEIQESKQAIKTIPVNYKKPSLMYMAVDMKVSQKFFLCKNNDVVNPFYGTLVNSDLVSNCYDFYLIAQHCNRGTARPSYYKVLYSDSEMEEGVLEELIYSQCFNYMNWTGSVRVPGVMQYAKKLATFISDNINTKNEAEQLNKHLYYI